MTRNTPIAELSATRRDFIQGVGITFTVGATGVIGACSVEPGENEAAADTIGNDAVSPNA